MNFLSQTYVVVAQLLLVAVLLMQLAAMLLKDGNKSKFAVLTGVALCMLLPLHGLTVAQWLRSVVGDLSVLTLVVLANVLARKLFNITLMAPLPKRVLLLSIVLAGMVLYPAALGLTKFDPYTWGYAPLWMSLVLGVYSLYGWYTGMRGLAVVLLLPLLAFNLRLLESANLWDYLLDPVLLVYAVVQCALYARTYWLEKQGRVA